MKSDLYTAIAQIASERGIPREAVLTSVEHALKTVYKKMTGTEEEVEATLDVLPKNTRQIGFYSYGEISPYTTGACDLHNQTMTLTTISEV